MPFIDTLYLAFYVLMVIFSGSILATMVYYFTENWFCLFTPCCEACSVIYDLHHVLHTDSLPVNALF